jgi:hypothetical protein
MSAADVAKAPVKKVQKRPAESSALGLGAIVGGLKLFGVELTADQLTGVAALLAVAPSVVSWAVDKFKQ